jgi:toxin ParE1/3/4
MTFQLFFKEEARQEITTAFNWYELQVEGLGLKFKTEVDGYMKRIQTNPKLFQNIYKEFKHAVLKKFPFRIFFTVENKTIFIFGIFHTKRNPAIIARRIRKR